MASSKMSKAFAALLDRSKAQDKRIRQLEKKTGIRKKKGKGIIDELLDELGLGDDEDEDEDEEKPRKRRDDDDEDDDDEDDE